MNIIEAVKSGKRIKRSMWSEFKHYENHYGAKYTAREDILADDWEVEKGAVTITEKDFNFAVQRTLHEMDPDEHGFWDKLRKNIGL